MFILSLYACACLYENEEELFAEDDNSQCETTNVSFANTVRPILQNNCFSCHSNLNASSLGSGIKLEEFNDVMMQVNNGKLSGVINHDVGFPKMPLGGAKLDDCSINKIDAWISQGAKNN